MESPKLAIFPSRRSSEAEENDRCVYCVIDLECSLSEVSLRCTMAIGT